MGAKAESHLLYLAGGMLIGASFASLAGWWSAFSALLLGSGGAVLAYLAIGQFRVVFHWPSGHHPFRLRLTLRQTAAIVAASLGPYALLLSLLVFSSSPFVARFVRPPLPLGAWVLAALIISLSLGRLFERAGWLSAPPGYYPGGSPAGHTGSASLIGRVATVVEECAPEGRVRLGPEFWRARATNPPALAGTEVLVRGVEGLVLVVERRESAA